MKERIQVGKIINTHGIKGELKVLPLTDNEERFNNLEEIYIENKTYKIIKVWYKKKQPIIKLEGYDNINDVMKFKNKLILIDYEDAVKLPEDTYFIFQIKGLDVYKINGEKIGYVKDVLINSGNHIYVIKNSDKEYLIPAVKEFIKDVDIDNNKIIIDPIEGLLE